MTSISALAVAALLATNTNPQFEGHWGGELDLGPAQLRIEIILEETDGSWSGELVSVDQGNARVPATRVTVENDRVIVDLSAAGARYEAELLPGGTLDGEFHQAGQVFELHMSALAADTDPEPAATSDDRDQEFSVSNGDVTLAGALRLPEGDGPFPAVVIISGSGPQDRDMTVGEHRVFATLAAHLADAGFASLRLDDRGVGGSDAVIPHHPQVIADDMGAALDALRSHPSTQGQCVGYVGHSEGSSLAFLAASRSQPDFILSLAGMHASMAETLIEQGEALVRASGGGDADVAAQRAVQDVVMTAMRDSPVGEAGPAIEAGLVEAGLPQQIAQQQAMIWGQAYAQNALDLDPASAMQAYEGPVSAIFGGSDLQVLADNMSARVSAARTDQPTRLRTLAGHNHLLQQESSGLPAGYTSAQHAISPVALEAIEEELGALINQACQ